MFALHHRIALPSLQPAVAGYHIFAKEWEARSLRTELIESFEQDNKDIDIARAAGLESPDVQETIGKYNP